jgi:hypothetical protein
MLSNLSPNAPFDEEDSGLRFTSLYSIKRDAALRAAASCPVTPTGLEHWANLLMLIAVYWSEMYRPTHVGKVTPFAAVKSEMYRPPHMGKEVTALYSKGDALEPPAGAGFQRSPSDTAFRATVAARRRLLAAYPLPRRKREEYRDSTYNLSADDTPISAAALVDFNEDATGGSSDARNAGYIVSKADDTPYRSLRNLDKESRTRAGLRKQTRRDQAAFFERLPADVFDRLFVAHGDDVPTERDHAEWRVDPEAQRWFGKYHEPSEDDLLAPMRHPTLAPSWGDEFDSHKFAAAPRLKGKVRPVSQSAPPRLRPAIASRPSTPTAF